MFSTMPRTGTLTFLNIARPRRASIKERSCGVEMMTAPLQRHVLRQGELCVAGAGRHVDHENIERAPGHVAQHLG